MDKMILALQTIPAVQIGLTSCFRKEVIKVGSYRHPSTGDRFTITTDTLDHFVVSFSRYLENGHVVPIPLGHDAVGKPEANAGWVTEMYREDDILYCTMDLLNPKLALTTDVSVCIETFKDEKDVLYTDVITHVALCTNPVIGGLDKFTKLSLSKETSMEFLKKLAVKLGLKENELTEDKVLLALDVKKEADKKVELSTTVDPIVKLVSEGRALKLAQLVTAGLLTPAVKEVIEAKYVKVEAVTLSLANKVDDGFDILCEVLVANHPAKLGEMTGIQSIELANNVKPASENLDATMDKIYGTEKE